MYFKKFLALCAVAVAAFSSTIANAAFYTEESTINAASTSPASGPPLELVIQIFEGNGRLATNTYGTDPNTGAPLIRTVGMALITSVQPFASGITGPGTATTNLLVAFAIEGSALSVDTASFTKGGFGIWAVNGSTVLRDDPSTWFPAGQQAFYEGTLAGKTDIKIGYGDAVGAGSNPGDFAIPAADVNISAVNTAILQFSQAPFLFNETYDPDNFLTVTSNYQGGALPTIESVLSTVSSQGTANTGASAIAFLNTDGKKDIFDQISNEFLGNDFATWGTGTQSDYTPGTPGVGVGDFSQVITVTSYPGLQAVPEPGTISLLGMGLVGLGLVARRRKAAK